MMANRDFLSARFEPLQVIGADPPFGLELSDKQAVVRAKRILVVDDEEPQRACVRMMLELDGHQVTEAANGAEALNLLALGQFDLVITDLEMPVMNGNELVANLKLLAPSLPILMITASAKAGGDVENPVDALLNKPITVPDLRGALGKLLSDRPAERLTDAEPRAVLV